MNSKPLKRLKTLDRLPEQVSILSLLIILIVSCGNWGWESIETDNQERLNVFGLISLDDSLESFVIVHRTLDTAGPDAFISRHDTIYFEIWDKYNENAGQFEPDTFWYDPPIIMDIYESKYFVKNASVTISDGTQEFSFVRSPRSRSSSEYFWYENIFQDSAIYLNVDHTFHPQPNSEYFLHISTPDDLELTGSLMTPNIPSIYGANLPDTLSMLNQFEVSWKYSGDYHSSITTGQKVEDYPTYICGINQIGAIEPGDTTWFSVNDPGCFEQTPEPNSSSEITIRLRFLDENYYNYFMGTDSDIADISNFLVGTGSIGAAIGVENGYGVFGAISADRITRIAIP
ncbi:MAG: DUF4249 domain-containing protein [Candidatus Marinimicrobia bacterium]|nr:DUF4249 domain-containing protein [Candidatus Neomarinimicrobiota bacterium]